MAFCGDLVLSMITLGHLAVRVDDCSSLTEGYRLGAFLVRSISHIDECYAYQRLGARQFPVKGCKCNESNRFNREAKVNCSRLGCWL